MIPRTEQALALVRRGIGAQGWQNEVQATANDTVVDEGLEGLFIARGGATSGPPAWQDAYITTATRTVVAFQELALALGFLHDAGYEVAVLPGAALLRFYPDASCRPMDDIDLLCAPGQRAAVAEIRLGQGWATAPRFPDLLSGRHVCLDLHDDLFHCARIEARRQAGWLDPNDVWSRRRQACVEGHAVWVLGAEDEVLYTAAHALRHSYRRVTWLIDLALQLSETSLDIRTLRARGEVNGLARPVLLGMALLKEARVDVSEAAQTWYRQCQPGVLELRLLRWMLGARQRTCAGELLWYWTSPSWRSRLRLLREFVFPRTEVLLQVFPRVPHSLAPIVYALRCGQLIRRLMHEVVAMTFAPVNRRTRRG